jgi:hypothetical protein
VLPLKSSKQSCWKLIGNDIVDLLVAARESNWKRKGYLQKIFTQEEQCLILSSPQPDAILWLLWSMKEAAYKIYSRKKGIRCFAPTQLRCEVSTLTSLTPPVYTGKVWIGEDTYLTESTSDGRMVHTVCASSIEEIRQIKVDIFLTEFSFNNYGDTKPDCVSHHGAYLALVYLNSNSLQ